MIETGEALLVAVVLVLPGLVYEAGIERSVGYWRTSFTDRLWRFFLHSAVLQLGFIAPSGYLIWREILGGASLSTASLGQLSAAWAITLATLLTVFVAGVVVGEAVSRRESWTKWLVGTDPAPQAWDYLFSTQKLTGYVRVLTTSGRWLAGFYGRSPHSGLDSFASNWPDPRELYLSVQVQIDPDSGELLLNEDGAPELGDTGLLVRGEDISHVEFIWASLEQAEERAGDG